MVTPCSQLAATESMAGTAPHVRIWIAVETPGPWPRNAVTEILGGFAPPRDVRIIGIRRSPNSGSRVFIAHPQLGSLHETTVDTPTDLVNWDFTAMVEGHLPGHPSADNPVLVCTNGRRDQCCAVSGRALLRRSQSPVWECTHLGGHRFAPVVLRLADGYMFGRVTDEVLAGISAGQTPITCARGRTWLTPAAQAAEILMEQRGIAVHGVHVDDDDPGIVILQTNANQQRVRMVAVPSNLVRPESCGGEVQTTMKWRCEDWGVD
jgi:hypothetical protein